MMCAMLARHRLLSALMVVLLIAPLLVGALPGPLSAKAQSPSTLGGSLSQTRSLAGPGAFASLPPPPSSSPSEVSPTQILESVPITLMNYQMVAAPNPFQQMVVMDSSKYSRYEAPNLQNVIWYYPNGTVIPAWIESGASSSSNATVWWLRLRGFPAHSSLTVYMGFAAPDHSFLSASGPTGQAPQLSPTYGEYDDGADVFLLYFDGVTPLSDFVSDVTLSRTSIAGPNGENITALATSGQGTLGLVYVGNYLPNEPIIAESSVKYANAPVGWPGADNAQVAIVDRPSTTGLNGISVDMAYNSYYFSLAVFNNGSESWQWGHQGNSSAAWHYASITYTGPSATGFCGYIAPQLYTTSGGYSGCLGATALRNSSRLYLGLTSPDSYWETYVNWMRARAYPPNGVMPYYRVWPAGPGAFAYLPLVLILNDLTDAYLIINGFFWANALAVTATTLTLAIFSPAFTRSRAGAALRRNWGIPFLVEFAGFLSAAAVFYSLGMTTLANSFSSCAYITLLASVVAVALDAWMRGARRHQAAESS